MMDAPALKVAVIWSRFGHYHLARLEAAGARIAETGGELVGIEVASMDTTYAWSVRNGNHDFTRDTLFPGRDYLDLKAVDIASSVRAALDRHDPEAVAINGWRFPEAVAALRWAHDKRRGAVLMSDSKADDMRRARLKEALKARIVRNFDAALVAGAPHRDYVVRLGVPPGRVFAGYDVVDNAFFITRTDEARRRAPELRAELGLPERFFLATGRFISVKNLPRLLEAYAAYRRQAGGKAWGLVICGAGPLESELKQKAGELGLGEVVWPGFLDPEKLVGYYAMASCLIHASTKDTWALVVNEAMASGLPILISERVGCRRDLIAAGENGFVFDPFSVESMADAMRRMASLPAEDLERMGRASRTRIADWGLDRFAAALVSACKASRVRAPRGLLTHVALHLLPVREKGGP